MAVRIVSAWDPRGHSGRLTTLALRLVSRAQVMGLLPPDLPMPLVLDEGMLRRISEEAAAAGIARHAIPLLGLEGSSLEEALQALLDAIDASPHPDGEWAPAREILGDDLLARLLADISPSSLRRYAAGTRDTPDEVAWRLHVVARMLASLLGSYNHYGIRRWFERPRSALQGRTPADALRGAAHEDDPELRAALELAERLEGAGSAS